MTADVPNEVKAMIIEEEIVQWQATSYRMEIRHRVFAKVNNEPGMKAVEREMENIEVSIDELEAVLAELNGQE